MGFLPETIQSTLEFPITVPEGERKFTDLLKKVGEQGDASSIRTNREINGHLEFGYPDAAITNGQLVNMRGSWVTITLATVNDLGTGSNSAVAGLCTHNLDVQTHTVVGATNTETQLNVRWMVWGWTYGDFTGAVNPQVAATANATHVSCHYRVGDAITTNAIDMRFHSDITPVAATPLKVDLFFIPALA